MQDDTYNKGGFQAFVFSMLFSLGFMTYISLFGGVDLQEIPDQATSDEQVLAEGEAPAAAAPVDVSQVEDPWVSSDDLIAHGDKVYQMNCAVCHGAEGKGDGAAGAGLNPPPRSLVTGQWTQGGDSISLHKTITNGIPGTSMAAFGHLGNVDRWAMVHWIHSITEDRVEDNEAALAEYGASTK